MKINYKILIYSFVLIFTVLFSFYPSLKNSFVNCDDNVLVTENVSIKSFSLNNLKDIFTKPYCGLYHPLVQVSYALEYKVFKLNPSGYHLTNLVFHLLNCLLVFWIFLLISGNIVISFITAVLFGIHPMHVESVAWISERKDVLYSIFFLGSIVAYLYYRTKNKAFYYIISISLFVLSLLSKVMAVSLPFALIIFDYISERKDFKKIIYEKIPYFVLSILFAVIAFSIHYGSGEPNLAKSFILNLKYALFGIVFYIYKMIYPVSICFGYPFKPEDFIGITFISIFPAFAMGVITSIVLYSMKFTRKIFFGALFFIITIFPVIQLVPSGQNIPWDRYTYIPFIGLFYIVAEGFNYFRKQRFKRIISDIVLILMILILAFLTFQRTKTWKSSFSLWNSVLKVYPNTARALKGLGDAYKEQGDYKKALQEYSKALESKPGYIDALNNRGNLYSLLSDYANAEKDFNFGIKISQKNPGIYYNRGLIYEKTNRLYKAVSDYSNAIALSPGNAEFYNNRGVVFARLNKYQLAINDFEGALKLNPQLTAARTNLEHALKLITKNRNK
ncbi:MAG: tetratricopeptide repeat protein [Elusimicrobia bacterium]|nr:tetratricopeptide repeat protein [Elusimicrobiota bacterium]